jgi:hypothetical protein
MGYLILLIAGLTFVFVVVELPVLYLVLKRTEDRNLRQAILVITLVPGMLLAMSSFIDSGGPAMVYLSLLFIGPVAALTPPFVFPGIAGPGTRFLRILSGYLAIIVFEIFLVYLSVQVRIARGPSDLLDVPGSGAIIYAGLAVLDIIFAFAAYRILRRVFPGLQEQHGDQV